jgi:glycosyltransferase involved in cell wall biosynthesis
MPIVDKPRCFFDSYVGMDATDSSGGKNMPKVSVVMASYNHFNYVREAVRSVLAQSFTDFELIIVDDASSDNSPLYLRTLKDPRVRLIEHAVNQGVSATFNEAVEASSGEYIAVIASDDRWHEDNLARKAAWLDANPSCLAVFSKVRTIDAQGEPVDPPPYKFPDAVTRWDVLCGLFSGENLLCAPSEMLRRSAVAGRPFYDLRFLQLQDLEQHIRIALQGDIHVLPDASLDYRWHGGNLSHLRLGVMERIRVECTLLFDMLAAIDDATIINNVFPELAGVKAAKALVPFAVARRILNSGNLFNVFIACRLISTYFTDPGRAKFLFTHTDFSVTDFYELTTQVGGLGRA